jgi:hypothetical protein
MGETWRVKSGEGAGGFLCPPGDPSHYFSVEEGPKHDPRQTMSVYAAVDDAAASHVPADIRDQARTILGKAQRRYPERWIAQVYGYFQSMYVSYSGSRDVNDLISDRTNALPAERHAAVAFIRQYLPDHPPRTDLITNPGTGYGSYPCVHCGRRVQYSARSDALVLVTRAGEFRECPDSPNGAHED